MSELNKLKVVDFTAGRLSSDDINTDIPFRDNFDKTRTIQQANAVIGAYVNRNYKDMQNKADKDEIPTKLSELENDSGYITEGDIPTKTSDLENDSGFITSADVPTKTSELDNDSGFITNEVDDLTNYLDKTTVENEFDSIWGDMQDFNGELGDIETAIDFKTPKRVGDLVVDSVISRNMFNKNNVINGYLNTSGVVNSATGYVVSDYIPVIPSEQYTYSGTTIAPSYGSKIALYDSSKNFVSYLDIHDTDTTIIIPNNVYYFRTTIRLSELNTYQFEPGSYATPHKDFENLKGKDFYSNEEIIIGEYLHKTHYRKVLESTTYATSYQIPANNIDKITNISGMVKRNDYDIWQFIPSRLDNASFKAQFDNIQYSNTSATVNISFGTSWASAFSRIIIILEYTKTTD